MKRTLLGLLIIIFLPFTHASASNECADLFKGVETLNLTSIDGIQASLAREIASLNEKQNLFTSQLANASDSTSVSLGQIKFFSRQYKSQDPEYPISALADVLQIQQKMPSLKQSEAMLVVALASRLQLEATDALTAAKSIIEKYDGFRVPQPVSDLIAGRARLELMTLLAQSLRRVQWESLETWLAAVYSAKPTDLSDYLAGSQRLDNPFVKAQQDISRELHEPIWNYWKTWRLLPAH